MRAKVPGIAKKLSQEVVHFVQALRRQDLFKSPGVAETLDWAAALTELDVVALDPATVSDTLGVLLKYQDDIARIEGTKAKELLDAGARGAARGGVMHPRAMARMTPADKPRRHARRTAAASPRTSSISRARCAPPAFRSGRGSVLDALEAVQAAGVGTREDFYWTLHAVFVKRHEHSVLFDQAFRMFFRKRAYLDKLLAMLLAAGAGRRAASRRRPGAQRVQEALFSGMNDKQAAGGARGRARRAPHGVRPRGAAEEGLRADERGRDRRRPRTRSSAGAAARRGEDAPPRAAPRTATSSTCAAPCAPA